MSFDHDEQQQREYLRQLTVEKAEEAADRIIFDASDSTDGMTDRLTADLAVELIKAAGSVPSDSVNVTVDSALNAIRRAITGHDEEGEEVRDALWARVAQKIVVKVTGRFESKLLRWDMEHPALSN